MSRGQPIYMRPQNRENVYSAAPLSSRATVVVSTPLTERSALYCALTVGIYIRLAGPRVSLKPFTRPRFLFKARPLR